MSEVRDMRIYNRMFLSPFTPIGFFVTLPPTGTKIGPDSLIAKQERI